MTKTQLKRLADLETNLNAIVDQIEAEWVRDGIISNESARKVHALLKRALAL